MSLGFQTAPLKNPNNCTDPYAPSFWLGKPGALTQLRMPDAGWARPTNDHFAVHDLLDGESVDRSPYVCRQWQFSHQWLTPDVTTVFMEYATRQRGIGPFILVDPQMKNLLTPNQASGTDALHTTEGFLADTPATVITVIDTMSRNVTGGLGNADTGQAYTVSGTAADYSVNGTIANIQPSALNNNRAGLISGDIGTNRTVQVDIAFSAIPASGQVRHGAIVRGVDSSNFYSALLEINSAGTPTFTIAKRVAATPSVLATATSTSIGITTVVAGTFYTIEAQAVDNFIRARVWLTGGTKPTIWHLEVQDTSIPTGVNGGFVARNETAVTTHVGRFDNFLLTPLVTSALSSSTDDFVQGERSLSWTLSPTVTGTSSVLHVLTPTGLYGFCVPATSLSGKKIAFSGSVKLASTSTDVSAQVTPSIVFMNGVGSVQSTLSGATVTAVPGTAGTGWQTFCVTGSVPAGSAGVYLEPRFLAVNATMTAQTVFLFDQLQLEIIDGTTCTQWEYGQGQPLVSVRSDGENVPRILRTNMNFVCLEVT